jgi:hypothetical protein
VGGIHLQSAQRGSDLGLGVLARCRVNIVPTTQSEIGTDMPALTAQPAGSRGNAATPSRGLTVTDLSQLTPGSGSGHDVPCRREDDDLPDESI